MMHYVAIGPTRRFSHCHLFCVVWAVFFLIGCNSKQTHVSDYDLLVRLSTPTAPTREWLNSQLDLAREGNMLAKLRYASWVDLWHAEWPLCDRIASERLQFVVDSTRSDNDCGLAIIQLGHLRRSPAAREALLRISTDSRISKVNRRSALNSLKYHIGPVEGGVMHDPSYRRPTKSELAAIQAFLTGPIWEDRQVAIDLVCYGQVVELVPTVFTAFKSERDLEHRKYILESMKTGGLSLMQP